MAGTSRRFGSGIYRRGHVHWLKVRTPAAIANLLPAFWRSSLRTTSEREALTTARIVRAALDMGFRAVEARMQSGTITAEQAEVVIAAIGRRALASAEALRALAGPRPEAAILAAQRAHAAEAEAWRGVLRRNELAAVLPLVAAAVAEAGLEALGGRPGPDLLREAARMMAVVAEENAQREDGRYAGDRDRMLSQFDPRETASPDARSKATPPGDRTNTFAPGPAVASPRFTVITGGAASGASQEPVTGPGLLRESLVSCIRVPQKLPALDAEGPVDDALPLTDQCSSCDGHDAASPSSGTADNGAGLTSGGGSRRALIANAETSVVAITAAVEGEAPHPTPNRKRRRAARRADRRPVASPEIARFKRLEPDAYFDLSLKEAFDLERDRVSLGGTNKSWMMNSNRGFTATETLACSFFGPDRLIRDIQRADCDDFVRELGFVPNTWGKSPALRRPMSELIDWANDKEERQLLEIERRAELENWSDEAFVAACEKAREERLSPANQYKHQGYFAAVLKTVYRHAKAIDDQPMKEAIWKKSYLNKLKAEAGERRVALGPEGRAKLFSRPVFANGPAASDDPLFWQPLLARYAGLRMEEGCQLKQEDIGVEDGVPVFRIRAGNDQRLKSEHSSRDIPIHPELIRLGILRLAAEKRRLGARWLFDVERGLDGTFSSRFSKTYYNWRCAEGIYERGKDFHSLRKDFYKSLRSAKVDYAARIKLMGHALNDVSEKHYGQDWDIAEMQEFIGRIPVDTEHVRPAA